MAQFLPTARDLFVAIITVLVISFLSHLPLVGDLVQMIVG